MAAFNFNVEKPDPDSIKQRYDECKTAIDCYFDKDRNQTFDVDFAFLSNAEIDEKKNELLEELSLRSSFFLLAYIESLFRTDFIQRVQYRKKGYKDVLTKAYREVYNPAHRLYSYSLTDVIFEGWKQYAKGKPNCKEMQDVLRTLPQYFDFRNWIAHGRYWVFKEPNYARKYNYTQIQILLDSIVLYFDPFLQKA